MKRQRVDYTGFSLSRLNEPRFSHIKLLGGWIIYFILYFLTENLIPRENCHPIHCWLDDVIPFNEFFLIFYCGWFPLVFGSLLYYLLYDVERFRKLQIYIMCTQAIAMFIYIVYPSRQDLRPEVFPRENILTALMSFIYTHGNFVCYVKGSFLKQRIESLPDFFYCHDLCGRMFCQTALRCGRFCRIDYVLLHRNCLVRKRLLASSSSRGESVKR